MHFLSVPRLRKCPSCLLATVLIVICLPARAYNLRQISHAEGLTNNAVLDILPEKEGYMWVGTCDGLSVYYGQRVSPVTFTDGKVLEGTLVEQLVDAAGETWARTAYGLYHWKSRTGILELFVQFSGKYHITDGYDGTLLVLDKEMKYLFYDSASKAFKPIDIMAEDPDPAGFGLTAHYFWQAGKNGVYRYLSTHSNASGEEALAVRKTGECLSPTPIISCVRDAGDYFLTDVNGDLYHYDFENGRSSFLISLSRQIQSRGNVTGVVEWKGQMYISFSNNGLIRCFRNGNGEWEVENLGLNVGIFRLLRDPSDRNLWIATDGQGIYKYWESEYIVRTHLSEDIDKSIGQPVRVLHRDRSGDLWVGTKGSGLIRIKDKSGTPGQASLYLSGSSPLTDNAVFAFEESRLGGFWIGTDGGLNFYNERSGSLEQVSYPGTIRYVHALKEAGDSLWISTVGRGVFLARFHRGGGRICLTDVRQYTLDGGDPSSNYFFSQCMDSSGIMWFCNRGKGLFRYENGSLVSVPFASSVEYPSVNDVFCMIEYRGMRWIGTGNGLICVDKEGRELRFSKADGLPSNTMHALGIDQENGIWVSTNGGLVRLDADMYSMETYGHNKGIPVIEYSDGAVLMDGGTLYFGGVNGWAEVHRNERYLPDDEWVPNIHFASMTVGDRQENLYVLFNRSGTFNPRIDLSSHERTLSIGFYLDDEVFPEDYDFYYLLDGWSLYNRIPLGQEHMVLLTNLKAGDHRLVVLARNQITGQETVSTEILIRRRPSLTESMPFRLAGFILLAALLVYFVLALFRRAHRLRESEVEQLRRQQKDALYEEKLAFFTNVTHEFKTPLSLIYVPCEQLLAYEHSDDFIRRQALKIKDNSARLNILIQEIIDYRRLETQHEQVHLQEIDVSELSRNICDYFSDLQVRNKLILEENIQPGIRWNTDTRCFARIQTNLITNALKYTPEGGTIRVGLDTVDDKLRLRVYNSGKGIAPEDRERIFNRYQILQNVEESRIGSITSRNGLGLSICRSTAELLGAGINVESVVGEYAEFIVLFPLLPLSPVAEDGEQEVTDLRDLIPDLQNMVPLRGDDGDDSGKLPRILAVDDRPEMLQLLTEALDEYHVVTALNAESAWEMIRQDPPELIISDIMMPGISGLELIRRVKQNKHTMHIPVIILSAKNTVEERVEGLDAGADVYLGKPFSIKELRSTIQRLLDKKDQMKEYYSTSASAFSYTDGELVSVEDKAFINEVNDYLVKAIPEGEVTVESLAEALHISTRNLYRKFKSLGLLPPNEYVREQKLLQAAKMLRTTNLTIQEIIYDCGFNNRAHFYKEFNKRYGMTPKEYRTQNRTK